MGTIFKKLFGLLPKKFIWSVIKDSYLTKYVLGTKTKLDDIGLKLADTLVEAGEFDKLLLWEVLKRDLALPYVKGTKTKWDDFTLEKIDYIIRAAIAELDK